jgi:signal transduction histidine kinase
MKVWSADGTLVYSSAPTGVDEEALDVPHLPKALSGEVNASIDYTEGSSAGELRGNGLIEVYAPIVFPGTSEVVGATEIHQSYGQTAQRIEVMTKRVFLVMGLGFVALYGILVTIVWGAWRTISRQRSALVDANAELESRVKTRTAENAQLYEELQDKTREKAVVDEVARIVTSTLDIHQVYQLFAVEMKRLVDFDRLSVQTIDPEAYTFSPTYSFGATVVEWEIGEVVPFAGTALERVFQTGRTLSREDIRTGDSFAHDSARIDAGLRSHILVPLIVRDRVLGTMSLLSHQVGAYGPGEQAILERLAHQIAPAVENTRLYESLQTALDELESRVEARTEELRGAEAQLVQSQKMEILGQLAGGVAHDFNNLLTPILGFSQLGVDELAPGHPALGHLLQVQGAAERGAALVGQLLSFSRRQTVKPQLVDLNEIVFNTDQMLRRLIGENIDLVFQPVPDLGLVRVDPVQIEQVLVNMAVNARDSMPDGGRLTIEMAKITLDVDSVKGFHELLPGHCVRLSISDTGKGMDKEVKAHLFEPFFTTKEVGKGTGLV